MYESAKVIKPIMYASAKVQIRLPTIALKPKRVISTKGCYTSIGVHNQNKLNKEARWLYAELKSHISFLAKSRENSLMRLFKKAHLAVAA